MSKFCSVDGCYAPVKGRGMCSAHYNRIIRRGNGADAQIHRATPTGEGVRDDRLEARRHPGDGMADGVHVDRYAHVTRIICCGSPRNDADQHSTQLVFNAEKGTLTFLDSRPNHETTLSHEHTRRLAGTLYALAFPEIVAENNEMITRIDAVLSDRSARE